MRVLLVRPDPGNERFGLGPFFRVEPLGLEYIGAALRAAGHQVLIVDLRFPPAIATCLRRFSPEVVGISCMHALEYDEVLGVAHAVRRHAPDVFVLVGGHAAAAYPGPLEQPAVDALCTDDGEEVVPALVAALAAGRPLNQVPALRLRTAGGFVSTGPLPERTGLDRVPLPARSLVDAYRDRYHCLNFRPVWLVETARGCPFRCSFCSVWQLYERSFRERSIGAVVEDLATAGPNVFIADDLFWNHPARSRELARAVLARGIRKRWVLVQSRTDLVARSPELLEAWRPLAEHFDIFFGLEAASDSGLAGLVKDATTSESVTAAEVSRALGYGVTGNFVIDPDWGEAQFEELWAFVERHGFQRAGYTLLTPLPGTDLFERMRPVLEGQAWFKYDMHHLLWEPQLGARRFFERYAETWRRSVLNLAGKKKWYDWVKQVDSPLALPYLFKILLRTQRLMQPEAYLAEHVAAGGVRRAPFPAAAPAPAAGEEARWMGSATGS